LENPTGVERLSMTTGGRLPLGVSRDGTLTHFLIVADHPITLMIYLGGHTEPDLEVDLAPKRHPTGSVWHVALPDLPEVFEYGYRITSSAPPAGGILLLDPYAKDISGAEVWGQLPDRPIYAAPWDRVRPRRCRVAPQAFDWGDDRPPKIPLADTIIYEMHVRGFTQHPSSGVTHPGTFEGIVEKIPYLQSLGVTAVELMPITEFEENDNPRYHPDTGVGLMNYWGYHPLSFFAPKASYAAHPEAPIKAFKQLVKALHEAGIEIILDMVYNHTGEGDVRCPIWSYRALAGSSYYLVDPSRQSYRNDTGCGNTVNANHPVVQELILDSLRYWATEMHVDGFRFDLASILTRGPDGRVLERPPLLDRIAADPVLQRVKLIAEPWDAGGLHQVGQFVKWGAWSEWNDRFRDDVRRFVKSDAGMVSALAARLSGSPDLYAAHGGSPTSSINFMTCHDGFTLADTVSYNQKHNTANGEAGRDGSHENYSWNCGEEGDTDDPQVQCLRLRQMKNMATLLLMSQGVPMILSGDEVGRSQKGNNNPYCQDNTISWFDWDLVGRNHALLRFFRLLLRFRKCHRLLRPGYYPSPQTSCQTPVWHGCKLDTPDWSHESRVLAMHVAGSSDRHIYLIANAYWEARGFDLPVLPRSLSWYRLVDTFRLSPHDIYPEEDAPPLLVHHGYEVGPRSIVVLVSRTKLETE
jgi:glycogen operon protein